MKKLVVFMFLPAILWGQYHNRIIFLHHSTGDNVYNYPAKGVPTWFNEYNASHGTNFQISDRWYPSDNNMPVDYYQEWIEGDDLDSLTDAYDVIIWKHCYPASDVYENTGSPDPSSSYQSIENYKAIYRLLRAKMDSFTNNIFIIWTIPPRHRLYGPGNGDTLGNAMRAREFTYWVKDTFLTEDGEHPNIYIFDFRGIVADSNNLFLKYEYERSHTGTDSHPNDSANNVAGPQFAQFIVNAIEDFESTGISTQHLLRRVSTVSFESFYVPSGYRDVKIAVYSKDGRLMFTRIQGRGDKVTFPHTLPGGIYFYVLSGKFGRLMGAFFKR